MLCFQLGQEKGVMGKKKKSGDIKRGGKKTGGGGVKRGT